MDKFNKKKHIPITRNNLIVANFQLYMFLLDRYVTIKQINFMHDLQKVSIFQHLFSMSVKIDFHIYFVALALKNFV